MTKVTHLEPISSSYKRKEIKPFFQTDSTKRWVFAFSDQPLKPNSIFSMNFSTTGSCLPKDIVTRTNYFCRQDLLLPLYSVKKVSSKQIKFSEISTFYKLSCQISCQNIDAFVQKIKAFFPNFLWQQYQHFWKDTSKFSSMSQNNTRWYFTNHILRP